MVRSAVEETEIDLEIDWDLLPVIDGVFFDFVNVAVRSAVPEIDIVLSGVIESESV